MTDNINTYEETAPNARWKVLLALTLLVIAAWTGIARWRNPNLFESRAKGLYVTAYAAFVSFANDVMPILQNRCFNCHGGEQTKEGLSFTSYETLMAGSLNGPVIVPGDAANSLLAQQLLNGKMPKRGPKLTPAQVQIIIDWISAGALNN